MAKVELKTPETDFIDHVITMRRVVHFTEFHGSPEALAVLIQYIGNVVWPGWQLHESGVKHYSGDYIEGCRDGKLEVSNHDFLDVAWSRVKKHLGIDGIIVHELK